jgi:hypothetical protein
MLAVGLGREKGSSAGIQRTRPDPRDELLGVFGGLPERPSSSAIRARSSSILARSAVFWPASSSILVSSDSTSPFRLSASSESILPGDIPSLNQTSPTRSMPHR